MIRPSFYAQSANNSDASIIVAKGEVVASDVGRRGDIASRIGRPLSDGKQLYRSAHVTSATLRGEMAMKITPPEHDVAGRAAPVICHIEDAELPASLAATDDLHAAIVAFLASIGRTAPVGLREELREHLTMFQKKKSGRRSTLVTIAVVVVGAAMLAGFWASSAG